MFTTLKNIFRSRPATPPIPVRPSIVETDPAVAALAERCAQLTDDEASALAGAWRSVEDDARTVDEVQRGRRLAHEARPEVAEAEDAADRAFLGTLDIPSDGVLYAAHDPVFGRAINAIRAHAAAVAARDVLSADVAAAMSRPWHEAIGPD